MGRAGLLTAIVVAGVTVAGVAAQQRGGGRGAGPRIPPTGTIEKVKDNLYKIGGAGSNTTVFITAEGVVLVDTKLANNGEAILAQVKTVTDKPVTTIINTHVHPDHNGSNDYFKAARPMIQVVTHENTKKWVVGQSEGQPRVDARQHVHRQDDAREGQGPIDLYYFGPGHTNGDAFVVFTASEPCASATSWRGTWRR
jgi:glyoxylase-like metal-dependent hydrolase (beta-lactamase superfamily II)